MPQPYPTYSLSKVWQQRTCLRAFWIQRCNGPRSPGLRYPNACAGVVDCQAGNGSVELKRYPSSHPFAQLQGSDNIIAFTTQRYHQQPLIIRYTPSPLNTFFPV